MLTLPPRALLRPPPVLTRLLPTRSAVGAMGRGVATLHVEYAGRGNEYGILFIFNLFGEDIHLEYARIHVIYRVHQAEYVLHIRVVAPQEYVNIYSTRRMVTGMVRGRESKYEMMRVDIHISSTIS